MDGRERFLAAINRQQADRMPCQVHSWMWSWLRDQLGGCDQYAAYERFGMDPVAYEGGNYITDPAAATSWRMERTPDVHDADGVKYWSEIWHSPQGALTVRRAGNSYTYWDLEPMIKSEDDFAIFERWATVPSTIDWTPVEEAKRRIGRHGIVRAGYFGFGQGSPWQDLCVLMGTEHAIMAAMDKPDWVEHCLQVLLDKKLRAIEASPGPIPYDLVEVGGGAGSSTVISPAMFKRFCLPYDRIQIKALHDKGTKVVYHLCGGLMPMLDLVVQTGADGLETMTPKAMGGDCDLAAAHRRFGDRLFFIGGFDQNAGFERGDPPTIRRMVEECHAACPGGGYICSPSDHFFFGAPENLQAFADTARGCTYP